MSCDTRRSMLCGRLAIATGITADTLEQVYATANAQAKQQRAAGTRTAAQDSLAAKQAQQMLDFYREADIPIPTHAKNGMPIRDTHAGHAAIACLVQKHRCQVCQRFMHASGCVDCPGTHIPSFIARFVPPDAHRRPPPHVQVQVSDIRTHAGSLEDTTDVTCVMDGQPLRFCVVRGLDGESRVQAYQRPTTTTDGTTETMPAAATDVAMPLVGVVHADDWHAQVHFADPHTGEVSLTIGKEIGGLNGTKPVLRVPETSVAHTTPAEAWADAEQTWTEARDWLIARIATVANDEADAETEDAQDLPRTMYWPYRDQVAERRRAKADLADAWKDAEMQGVVFDRTLPVDPNQSFASARAAADAQWTGADIVQRGTHSAMAFALQVQRIADLEQRS